MIVCDPYGATTDSVLQRATEVRVSEILKRVLAEDEFLCTNGVTVYIALAKTEGIKHHA